jgi:hypothetical protein
LTRSSPTSTPWPHHARAVSLAPSCLSGACPQVDGRPSAAVAHGSGPQPTTAATPHGHVPLDMSAWSWVSLLARPTRAGCDTSPACVLDVLRTAPVCVLGSNGRSKTRKGAGPPPAARSLISSTSSSCAMRGPPSCRSRRNSSEQRTSFLCSRCQLMRHRHSWQHRRHPWPGRLVATCSLAVGCDRSYVAKSMASRCGPTTLSGKSVCWPVLWFRAASPFVSGLA